MIVIVNKILIFILMLICTFQQSTSQITQLGTISHEQTVLDIIVLEIKRLLYKLVIQE